MKTTNSSLLLLLVSVINAAYAETPNVKVARNSANCFTGHIAANSPMYQSGELSKYLLLIKKIIGDEPAITMVKKSADNLEASVLMMGGSTKQEGAWLKDEGAWRIKTFCPGVDVILNK